MSSGGFGDPRLERSTPFRRERAVRERGDLDCLLIPARVLAPARRHHTANGNAESPRTGSRAVGRALHTWEDTGGALFIPAVA